MKKFAKGVARTTLSAALVLTGQYAAAQTASPADAAEEKAMLALARARNCITCHATDRTLLAPSYRSIAKRYANDSNAADELARSITDGSRGKWGSIPMPAGTQLAPGEARRLAVWILGMTR